MQVQFRRFAILTAFLLSACNESPPVPSTSPAPVIVPPTVDTSLPEQATSIGENVIAHRIALAANVFVRSHYVQNSTRGLFHAPVGNECVATIQAILHQASLPFVGPVSAGRQPIINVDDFRAMLVADTKNWVRFDPSSTNFAAAPGDIWVQGDGYTGAGAGQNHVGICQDWGCMHVLSNASDRGSFTWSDTPEGYAQYYFDRGFPYLEGAVYHHLAPRVSQAAKTH